VHPRDEAWIKQAALFWPQIQRIVPENYPLADTPTLARLSAEGILTNRRPDPAMAGLGDQFIRFLSTNQAALARAYNLDKVASLPEREGWLHDMHLHPKVGWIHIAKLDPDARQALLDAGLAIESHDWVGMHPNLADVYLCALAGELSNRAGTTPVTDGDLHHAGAYGWGFDTIARGLLPDARLSTPDQLQGSSTAETRFLMIAMRTLVPQNLDQIPIERLLKLRERYKDDFWNYRKRITDVTDDLAKLRGVTDLDTLAQHVELEYEKTLESDLSDLRRILKSHKLDTAETALAIKIAAPTTLLGTGVGQVAGIAAGAAAATAVGLFSTARGIRTQRRMTLAKSPATWLLRIEEELQPAGLARSIAQQVKAFLR
jgi:uncharacterized protein DUF6236